MSDPYPSTSSAAPAATGPPQPSLVPGSISPAELLALMQAPDRLAGRDYVVVDVRRTDIDTFHQTLPVVYELLRRYVRPKPPTQSGFSLFPLMYSIPIVIFHCNSCRGRGPRCAEWYADELARRGCETSRAVILEGGLNAWKEAYPELIKTVS